MCATSSYAFDKVVASSTGTLALLSSGNVTTTIGNELYFGIAWSTGHGDTWVAVNGYNDFAPRDGGQGRHVSLDDSCEIHDTSSNAWAAGTCCDAYPSGAAHHPDVSANRRLLGTATFAARGNVWISQPLTVHRSGAAKTWRKEHAM